MPETLLGCKNLGIILPMKSWTSCGIAIFWTRATTPTSSNSWGQLGICHLGMRKPTIWHSIWVVFPMFPNFTIHYIYIYISSFVFHVLIIFLSFLSVRSIYSSELRLECMLLLSCLEGFTMLVVVVSFFSSIWFSRTESVLNAVSMFSDTKLLNTFFSTGRIKCGRL